MTQLLQEAFERVAKLPQEEQNQSCAFPASHTRVGEAMGRVVWEARIG